MIDTKPYYAYCQCEALKLFWNELWPLEFLVHITYMDISWEHYFSKIVSRKLMKLHKERMIDIRPSCANCNPVPVRRFLAVL